MLIQIYKNKKHGVDAFMQNLCVYLNLLFFFIVNIEF